MTHALDSVSGEFAKFATGQKTNFKKMFQGLGEELVKQSTKKAIELGLGKLGLGSKQKPIDVWAAHPHLDGQTHVIVDNPCPTQGQNGQQIPGGGASGFAGLSALIGLGGVFGAGGSAGGEGLTEAVSSSISFMAAGGDVDPGKGYVVGDGGEPEWFSPKTAGTITPMSKMGGGDHYYQIDARGAQLGTENRIARSIEASHNAAVSNSIRASKEHTARTPQRTK